MCLIVEKKHSYSYHQIDEGLYFRDRIRENQILVVRITHFFKFRGCFGLRLLKTFINFLKWMIFIEFDRFLKTFVYFVNVWMVLF